MHGMYNPAEYPEGVPSPYDPVVEVYPNYVHGSNYTRAYFSEPWSQQPYNVLHGLGDASAVYQVKKRRAMLMGSAGSAALLGIIGALGAPKGRRAMGAAAGAVAGGICGVLASTLVFMEMETLETVP